MCLKLLKRLQNLQMNRYCIVDVKLLYNYKYPYFGLFIKLSIRNVLR